MASRPTLLSSAMQFAGIGKGLKPAGAAVPAPAPDPAPPADPAASDPAQLTARKKVVEDDEDDDKDDPDEDEDEDEMKGRRKAGRARLREQARIAAILADPAAADRAEFAHHLALNTRYPRADAVAMLAASPKAAAGDTRMERQMAGIPVPNAGPANPPPAPDSRKAIASRWDAAYERNNKRAGK